jgi:hypothetical protein
MKMKSFFTIILLASLFQGTISYSQTVALYNLPDNYHFDITVSQVLVSKKNAADTSIMHFFYTKNGDYAAAEINRKANMKGNLFIVITRDGAAVIFDEHAKSITVLSVRKLLSDFSGLTKWIRMDSLIANIRNKAEDKDFKSVKTGNSRQIGRYTSEEYAVSGNRGHKVSVWFAKVDFDTPGDFILGAVGGNLVKMMSTQMTGHPLFQALTQPKTLLTGINIKDSSNTILMDMHTASISETTTTIPTAGYVINNYYNMTLPEIFQAEMKKRNN